MVGREFDHFRLIAAGRDWVVSLTLAKLQSTLKLDCSWISGPFAGRIMQHTHKNRGWSFALRCMLLLLLGWPGPRPYIHNHQHFGQEMLTTSEFQHHLEQYHSRLAGVPVDPEMLHLHWLIVPAQAAELGQRCCVDCCSPDELRLEAVGANGLLNLFQIICSAPSEFLVDAHIDRPGAFSLVPHHPNVRLQQMYCSMHC